MNLIGYSKCGTCQKAKKWLEMNRLEYTFREIKTENPNQEEIRKWAQSAALPIKKFFNTSGLLYKSMNLKEALPKMTDEEMLGVLATDGMLVKRPILVGEDFVLLGFKEAEWEKELLSEERK